VIVIKSENASVRFPHTQSGALRCKGATGEIIHIDLGGTGPVRIKTSTGTVKSLR
jgi:hypothetical protein